MTSSVQDQEAPRVQLGTTQKEIFGAPQPETEIKSAPITIEEHRFDPYYNTYPSFYGRTGAVDTRARDSHYHHMGYVDGLTHVGELHPHKVAERWI